MLEAPGRRRIRGVEAGSDPATVDASEPGGRRGRGVDGPRTADGPPCRRVGAARAVTMGLERELAGHNGRICGRSGQQRGVGRLGRR